MIYLDTSVALAALFAEGRTPPQRIWTDIVVSSRLLEYEIMNRVNARALTGAHIAAARTLIDGVDLLELQPEILARALQSFPLPVRTLDALHLATMDFLRAEGQTLELATYDQRLAEAARTLGFPLTTL